MTFHSNDKYNRKCLFVATVASDSFVFVATLPVKKILKQDV